MKKRNKIVSLLLTFAMILTMMVNIVVAETDPETYSITITNATIGKVYSVYRVFDIETAVDGNNIYKVTGEWEGKLPADIFTVTDGIAETDKGSDDVIKAFNALKADELPEKATKEISATSATVVFSDLTPGYYYVKSSVGTIVSLINATDKDVTIIDKNQMPTWEPSDPGEPGDPDNPPFDPYDPDGEKPFDPAKPDNPDGDNLPLGKFVWEKDKWVKVNDAAIGEKLPFMINFYAPTYVGTNEIIAYTLTDIYGDAFTSVDNIKVYVDKTEVNDGVAIINEAKKGFFKVVLNMDKVVETLGDNYTYGNVSVKYDAILSNKATEVNENTAKLNWTQVPYNPEKPYDTTTTEDTFVDPDDPEKPGTLVPVDPSTGKVIDPDDADENTIYTPVDPTKPVDPQNPSDNDPEVPDDKIVPPATHTETLTYKFTLKKVDANNNVINADLGAKFVVRTSEDNTSDANVLKFVVDTDGAYKLVPAETTGDDVTTIINAGEVVIKGLDATTYYVEEKEAPEGYIGMDGFEEVEITSRIGVTNYVVPTAEITNNKEGSLLPTTGGVGTTIFYIVGSILVIGAGVLLVSRKRARH